MTALSTSRRATRTADATYRQELLDAALGYADLGWHVFPLRPHSKKPAVPDHPEHLCDRTDPRCQPLHSGWEQRSTTDPDRIERAWTIRAWGIGIACGPSQLVVVDLDLPTEPDHRSGAQHLRALANQLGQQLPITHEVATPSGGRHLYFTAPPSVPLGNTASRLGPHIDTRAKGGYVVAPPTRLDSAASYRTMSTVASLPALPAWLNDRLRSPDPRRPPPPPLQRTSRPTQSVDRYVAAALDGETDRIRAAAEGTRNNTLFTAAIALGQLVGAEILDVDEAHKVLLDAGAHHISSGAYSTSQAHKTILSGLDRGQRQPRQLPNRPHTGATR